MIKWRWWYTLSKRTGCYPRLLISFKLLKRFNSQNRNSTLKPKILCFNLLFPQGFTIICGQRILCNQRTTRTLQTRYWKKDCRSKFGQYYYTNVLCCFSCFIISFRYSLKFHADISQFHPALCAWMLFSLFVSSNLLSSC